MNHTKIETTLNIDSHLIPSMGVEASTAIGAAILEAGE